jgi:hypothetical protein
MHALSVFFCILGQDEWLHLLIVASPAVRHPAVSRMCRTQVDRIVPSQCRPLGITSTQVIDSHHVSTHSSKLPCLYYDVLCGDFIPPWLIITGIRIVDCLEQDTERRSNREPSTIAFPWPLWKENTQIWQFFSGRGDQVKSGRTKLRVLDLLSLSTLHARFLT